MRILLDTHAFIWAITEPERLSSLAAEALAAPDNRPLVSMASYWEMAIKVGLNKLDLKISLPQLFERGMEDLEAAPLSIEVSHILEVAVLPQFRHHRDPFDRMLVAQAQVENLPIVSKDRAFDDYGVERIW